MLIADIDSLSPEADTFLAEAVADYPVKQAFLAENWEWNNYRSWQFDLALAQLTLLTDRLGEVQAEAFLVATYCPADASFEWTWNNPRYSAVERSKSAMVQATSERLALAYLEMGMVPIPSNDHIHYLAAIAVKATYADGLFWSEHGEGQALFVVYKIRAVEAIKH